MNLQDSIKEFCDHEYRFNSHVRSEPFRLYAVDRGGYDCTGEVSIVFEGDEAILTFDGDFNQYSPTKTAVYRFKLVK